MSYRRKGEKLSFIFGGGGGYGRQIFTNICRNKRTPPDDAGDLIGEDLEELDLLRDPGRVFTCRKLGQTVCRKRYTCRKEGLMAQFVLSASDTLEHRMAVTPRRLLAKVCGCACLHSTSS